MDLEITKKRIAEITLSKSQNEEKVLQLDGQVKILKKKLNIDTDG